MIVIFSVTTNVQHVIENWRSSENFTSRPITPANQFKSGNVTKKILFDDVRNNYSFFVDMIFFQAWFTFDLYVLDMLVQVVVQSCTSNPSGLIEDRQLRLAHLRSLFHLLRLLIVKLAISLLQLIWKLKWNFALEFNICLTLSFRFQFTPSSIFIKSSQLLNKIASLLQVYYMNF